MSKQSTSNNQYDIAIIGGGLVGGSLAIALKSSGYSISLIEATAHDQNNPSFDDRTVALTWSSVRIFKSLGIWQNIQDKTPIKTIHVSRRNHVGSSLLSCTDIDTDALGYVVANKSIGNALWQHIQESDPKDLAVFCPESPTAIIRKEDGVDITLSDTKINARLLILADGGRSGWAQKLGFESEQTSYGKSAIITKLTVDREHNNIAYERFTKHGPIALLPYGEKRFIVAWTVENEQCDAFLKLNKTELATTLQQEFGFRAGRFLGATKPIAYPLSLALNKQIHNERVLLIGNAAHQVHPVAGQGFNLGLRDVANLHKLLVDAQRWNDDPASENVLAEYAAQSSVDANNIVRFTDGLLSIFQYSNPVVALPRAIGLGIVDKITPLRRAILAYSTGLSSPQNYLNKND